MALDTGRLLCCNHVTPIPISDHVIRRVERLAYRQGFQSLKFFTRTGEQMHDAHQIAGVDYIDDGEPQPHPRDDLDDEDDEDYIDDDESDDESDDDDDDDGDEPGRPTTNNRQANQNAHQHEEDDTNFENEEDDEPIIAEDDDQDEDQEEDHEDTESDAAGGDDVHDGALCPEDEHDDADSPTIARDNEDPVDTGYETPEDVREYDDDSSDEDHETSDEDADDSDYKETLDPRSGEDPPRRSSRESRAPERLSPKTSGKSYLAKGRTKTNKHKKARKVTFLDQNLKRLNCLHNLARQTCNDKDKELSYSDEEAAMLAQVMVHFNEQSTQPGLCFGQQYMLKKGLKIFQEKGHDASVDELRQMHDRKCFIPRSVREMSQSERRKAQEALMFLTEKRDGRIKGRMVYNGKPTREWLSKEEVASPTVSLEALYILGTIDAHERRDIMTADVPNAFIQTPMPKGEGVERVMMKITGVLVDMLVRLDPELYSGHVVFEKGRKVVYVELMRAAYGQLSASLLWYRKFRGDLEGIGFVFNDYDPCVANRTVNGKQHTVRFHVDDLLSSHVNPKVNDKFGEWLEKMYGEYKPVEPTRGKVHDYLGMVFDFREDGVFTVDMKAYVKGMIEDFPEELRKAAETPATEKLLDIGKGKLLSDERREAYHTSVAKGLFVCKRARPDIQPTIAVLSTRVKGPTSSDWDKLLRMMQYLKGTSEFVLRLRADSLRVVKWYVDASFAVHPDYRSHTGAVMTMGEGATQGMSRKQKLNTRSSTEAELVGADDAATMILWTELFMDAQGYPLEKNILFQDNKSAILLETNGKRSAGKRSRALNVRYFFLTDQVEKGHLSIEYCPTDMMWGDYMTKPLQGEKFRYFRDLILGRSREDASNAEHRRLKK